MSTPRRSPAPRPDLHDGFRDPRRAPAGELAEFLEAADRLPGFRAVQQAMRRALDPRPGMRLLDAGCGAGLETARLAADHPDTLVTGLDRNADLLRIARRRTAANLRWVHADLAEDPVPPASYDAVRTERVLMYLPDDRLRRALDGLIAALRPGGRLALFELDYGATILAPPMDDVADTLRGSLPQPLAGRRLPGLLRERGLREVSAEPFSFAVSEPVWRRIVNDTVTAAAPPTPDVAAWLSESGAAVARGEFVAAFTGILTSARRGQAAS